MSAMTKTKVLRIISILSLRDHRQLPEPPANLRPRGTNDGVRDRVGPESGALP